MDDPGSATLPPPPGPPAGPGPAPTSRLVRRATGVALATIALVALTTVVGFIGFAEGMSGFQEDVDEDLMDAVEWFCGVATFVLVGLFFLNLVLAAAELLASRRDRQRSTPRQDGRMWILNLLAAGLASPSLYFATWWLT